MTLGHVEGKTGKRRRGKEGESGAGCVAVKSYLARGWYLVHICNEIHDKWGGRLLKDLLGGSHLFNSAPAHKTCCAVLCCAVQCCAVLCCPVCDF